MARGVQRRIPGHGKYLMMFGVQSRIEDAMVQGGLLMLQMQGTNDYLISWHQTGMVKDVVLVLKDKTVEAATAAAAK